MISATAIFTPRGDVNARLMAALAPAADLAAEMVAEEARRLVSVDTGALAASIAARPSRVDGNRVTVEVVADMPYATYVEYGTGIAGASSAGSGPGPYDPNWPGMVASPYMRPALDTLRDDVMNVMARELKSEL